MIKHFIDLDSFTKKELRQILSFAQTIKKNPLKYSSLLKSKSLGLLFEKQSTRTRLSFSIVTQKGEIYYHSVNSLLFSCCQYGLSRIMRESYKISMSY